MRVPSSFDSCHRILRRWSTRDECKLAAVTFAEDTIFSLSGNDLFCLAFPNVWIPHELSSISIVLIFETVRRIKASIGGVVFHRMNFNASMVKNSDSDCDFDDKEIGD